MNRSQYIDAFNEINFTPHLELKIWDNLLSDSSLTSQPKIKKTHIFIYSLIATCLCIICIIFGMSLSAPKLTCDLLSNESISTLHGIKDIKKVHIEANSKEVIVNNQKVKNKEMVIFDNHELLKAGENVNFEWTLLGNNMICEFGYIFNGSYKKINEVTSNDIGVSFEAPETGTYNWCFINYSDKEVNLSGSISVNDLVYRNYGDDVIKADTNTVFIISSLENLLNSYEIEGVYALNRKTSTIYKISSEITDIEYRVQEKGYYEIYAQTEDGNKIMLNKYVTVEVDSSNDETLIGL